MEQTDYGIRCCTATEVLLLQPIRFFTWIPALLRHRIFFALQLLFPLGLLLSCSAHKEGSEICHLPFYETDRFVCIPGEKLTYTASAGLLKIGSMSMSVDTSVQKEGGKDCFHIRALARSNKGISWISQIEHRWDSWIDTANGLSVRMNRKVRENTYRAEQELKFYPDSQLITQRALHKPDKPVRRETSPPGRMNDLVNMIWKLRYTPFDKVRAGDTLQYPAYHDGEWIVLRVKYDGIRQRKSKRFPSYHRLVPVGIENRYLRGEESTEIWIETGQARRPIKIKVATYLGNLSIDLDS